MTALGFTSPATFEQNRFNRQAFFQNLVMQGSAERLRKNAIAEAKKEQDELRKKADQGGIFGGVIGAIGGGISGFVTGGPAGALVGAVKGGLSGYQTGRAAGDAGQGALIGALTGAGAGYEEKVRQETEQKAFDLKKLESGIKTIESNTKQENVLRKEFQPIQKKFNDVISAQQKIERSINKNSAAGDMAAIFSFMKVLDPGSTVREGEFANAQNSAGVPERLRNYYNNAMTGKRLGDDQMNDFLTTSRELFTAEEDTYKTARQTVLDIVENQKLDRVNIFGKERKQERFQSPLLKKKKTDTTKTKKSLIQKAIPSLFDNKSDAEFLEDMEKPIKLDRDIMNLYGGLR